ncbi:FeoA family protein [Saccharospirillum salsuginis]|uniref:Iron transporter FeoA n=1 Tax=Saccharospirillum salsuginis TaxID=418750 RepID=A0A918N8P5_9GAMM|nr:FeoA family protein [Saccharospirillum salsuginis]GGX49054.1 iron transporter FeoA [Saccharospirillum salsuginis]
MTLNDLPKARSATLIGFSPEVSDISRFLSMGLVPGAAIQVLRVAPLGCPLQVKAGSTLLSIRLTEAENIRVEETR